jgi:hypothetical protein
MVNNLKYLFLHLNANRDAPWFTVGLGFNIPKWKVSLVENVYNPPNLWASENDNDVCWGVSDFTWLIGSWLAAIPQQHCMKVFYISSVQEKTRIKN